ncbi:MAG: hypothetical protein WCC10_06120 [Tumebacillaceae bacterium]
MSGMFKISAAALTMIAMLGTGHVMAADSQMQNTVKQYRAQIVDARVQEEQIRSVKHSLMLQSRELRHLVRQANDDKLKEQVKNDLKPFHAKLEKAHELRQLDEELKKEIHAARLKKDLAEERRLTGELVKNKKQQLRYLQQAQQDLRAELKKVRGLAPT